MRKKFLNFPKIFPVSYSGKTMTRDIIIRSKLGKIYINTLMRQSSKFEAYIVLICSIKTRQKKGGKGFKVPARGFTHESIHNESKEWYTPAWIFEKLKVEFDLDPASPGADIVPWIPAKRHLTVIEDGLTALWEGRVWLNPPYGTDTPKWLHRLSIGGNGIALVFSRTDTEWFHRYAIRADAICFIKGRVRFIKATGGLGGTPGAGSLMLAYGKDNAEILESSGLGWVIRPPALFVKASDR